MERDELRSVLKEVLTEHFEVHMAHHEWIQARIDAEKERRDMFKSIGKAVIEWSVVGILGTTAYWIQHHIKL